MTVEEQIAQRNKRDWIPRLGVYVLGLLAIIVPIMAVVLALNVSRTAGVADRTAVVTETVRSTLALTRVAICQSRATTVSTAPMTIKESRAIQDALSEKARKTCPDLDYDALLAKAEREKRRIAAGEDPAVIARD